MTRKIKIALLVCLFILASAGYGVFAFSSRAGGMFPEEDLKLFKLFTQAFQIVKSNYVDPEAASSKKLVYSALKGMLELDAHSSFLEPEETKDMEVETKGVFGGLGIEITIKDSVLTVVSPIDDTPASRAGILAGDQIIKIEDKLTKGMTTQDAVKLLRGTPGTKVTIHILREGLKELKSYTITRDVIKIRSVKSKLIDGSYAYIKVTQFQEQTVNDFRKALGDLKEKTQLKGMVFDLRNNPGGLLDQAVKLADEFIDEGVIVYTKGRDGKEGSKFYATKGRSVGEYPVVCLVNAGSASASEIVSGALQDHKAAVVMGSRTFGKASVQTIFPLEDGASLRLTTARYYTPNGRLIQAKGIVPDIEVKDGMRQHVIREKDLPKHLSGDGKDAKNGKDEKVKAEPTKDDEKEEGGNEMKRPAANPEDDELVRRGLDLIKSWEIFKGK